jgi:hypothetical protein
LQRREDLQQTKLPRTFTLFIFNSEDGDSVLLQGTYMLLRRRRPKQTPANDYETADILLKGSLIM